MVLIYQLVLDGKHSDIVRYVGFCPLYGMFYAIIAIPKRDKDDQSSDFSLLHFLKYTYTVYQVNINWIVYLSDLVPIAYNAPNHIKLVSPINKGFR